MAKAKSTVETQQDGPKISKGTLGKKKLIKSANRAVFLQKMPKGGLAIEIGVWRGEFSGQILETLAPKRLWLVDPWGSVAQIG